jgi:hypothetical protein
LQILQRFKRRQRDPVITLADVREYAQKRIEELVETEQAVVIRALNDIAPQRIPIAAYAASQ